MWPRKGKKFDDCIIDGKRDILIWWLQILCQWSTLTTSAPSFSLTRNYFSDLPTPLIPIIPQPSPPTPAGRGPGWPSSPPPVPPWSLPCAPDTKRASQQVSSPALENLILEISLQQKLAMDLSPVVAAMWQTKCLYSLLKMWNLNCNWADADAGSPLVVKCLYLNWRLFQ